MDRLDEATYGLAVVGDAPGPSTASPLPVGRADGVSEVAALPAVPAQPEPRREAALSPNRETPTDGTGTRVQRRRLTVVALVAVVGLTVGVPLLLAVHTGSIRIPHNDAWAYGRVAREFATTGHVALVGWGEGGVVGQVVLFGPLGRWVVAQQLGVAVLAAVGLVGTYALLKPRIGRWEAMFATALVGVFPGFGLLATSFMLDVPAYVAVILGLLVGERALRRGSFWLLLAATAIGIWGATVTEQVLAVPVSLLALAWWRRPRFQTCQLVLVGVIAGVALGAFELWRRSLPFSDPPVLSLEPLVGVRHLAEAYLALALFVSPAVLLAATRAWRAVWQERWLGLVTAAVAMLVVGTLLVAGPNIFPGNYLSAGGAYSAAEVGARVVLPSAAMWALAGLASVSAVLLPAAVRTGWRRLGGLPATFATLTVLGYVAVLLVQPLFYDRLLLPLIPLVAAAAAGPLPRLRTVRVSGLVALAGLGALSLALTANALALDAREWHVAQRLVATGVPPRDINAGLDWVGWHAAGPADAALLGSSPRESFYLPMFYGSRACLVVSSQAVPDATLVGSVRYETFAVLGTSRLRVYRTTSCSLPQPTRTLAAALR